MVADYNPGYLVRSLVRVPGSGSNRRLDSVALDLSNVSAMAARVPVDRTLPKALLKPTPTEQKRKREEIDAVKTKLSADKSNFLESKKRPISQVETTETYLPPKIAKIDRTQNFRNIAGVSQNIRYVLVPITASPVMPAVQQSQLNTSGIPVNQIQQPPLTVESKPANCCNRNIVLSDSCQQQTIQQNTSITTGMSAIMQQLKAQTSQPTTTSLNIPITSNVLQELQKLKKENEDLNRRLVSFQNIFRNKQSLQYLATRLAGIPQA